MLVSHANTPKTSSSSSPPSGCSRRSAGRRCRRWRKSSARAARSAARRRARWCWCRACARRWTSSTRSLPPEAIATAVDELTRDRSAMSLEAANREVYGLLKDGMQVSVPDREHGGQKTERVRVIDWEQPAEQRLPARQPVQRHRRALHLPARPGRLRQRPAAGGDRAEEARRAGARGVRREPHALQAARTDPAALLVQRAADRLQRHRQPVGSLTADWERFFEWKRIEREDEPRRVSLEVMLRGTCDPRACSTSSRTSRCSPSTRRGWSRSSAQNHQFLGVNNAIAVDAGGAQAQATAAAACSGRRRAAARASRWCSSRRRCCARCRATGPSWSSPTAWSWTTRSPRPSRPTGAVTRGRGRRVPRRERRAPARAAARQPPLRLHADPQVPDAGGALRPRRRDRADRRGAPQPVRHAGAEHARGAAEGAVPGLHRHAADRRRGAHRRSSATTSRSTTSSSRSRTARRCRCSTRTARRSCSSSTRT